MNIGRRNEEKWKKKISEVGMDLISLKQKKKKFARLINFWWRLPVTAGAQVCRCLHFNRKCGQDQGICFGE